MDNYTKTEHSPFSKTRIKDQEGFPEIEVNIFTQQILPTQLGIF